MSKIPKGITREHVLDALASLDRGEPHLFGESTGYDLVEGGKRYLPKAVLGIASRRLQVPGNGPCTRNQATHGEARRRGGSAGRARSVV